MKSPTNEIVATAWLRAVPGLPGQQINTTLPKKEEAWAPSGFVQVLLLQGRPDLYVPQRQPIFQVDLWGVNPGSGKPPWGQVNDLAETIVAACEVGNQRRSFGRVVTPPQFSDVFVQTGHVLTEPKRIPDDEARFAHYQLELQLYWYRLPS